MRIRMFTASICGVALLVSMARPAEAAEQPPVTTRQFNGTASAQLTTGVQIAGCLPMLSLSVTFTIDRPNLGSWNGSFQGCVPFPGPTQESFSFSGPLTLVTPRGTRLTGVGEYGASIRSTGMILTITGSDGEYVGGRLDVDLGGFFGTSGPVTGTVTVQPTRPIDRPFNASVTFTKFMPGTSVHCPPGSTFVDAAGIFTRPAKRDWAFAFQMCSPPSSVLLGSFSITTPSGIVFSGTPTLRLSGTVVTITLTVQRSTHVSVSGEITLTVDTAQGNNVGMVAGSLRVG